MLNNTSSKKFFQKWLPADSLRLTEMLVGIISSRVDHIIDYPADERKYYTLQYALAGQRQIEAFTSKNVDTIEKGVNLKEVCMATFLRSELSCYSVNNTYMETNQFTATSCDFQPYYEVMRRKISDILGPVPTLDELKCSFGPGASSTVKGKTTARFKFGAAPVCSKEAVTASQELLDLFPLWQYLHKGKVRVGQAQLTFVPKNAKTSRSILIEPLMNTFVQKGIGTYIKRRLLSFGCNLYDQSINRDLARFGSKNNLLATIDLSSASDMIAFCVVMDLLPTAWVELLSTWRTGTVYCKEFGLRNFELNKFSSMGNGFTFELESLIFFAAISSVSDLSQEFQPWQDCFPNKGYSVYGDDIIVPSAEYAVTRNLLESMGFVINEDKSHYTKSNFRESCGGDFLFGINVRPFYLKEDWSYARLVGFLNHDRASFQFLTAKERLKLLKLIPAKYRNFGPAGYGDGHIHTNHLGREHGRHRGFEGTLFRSTVKVPDKCTTFWPDADLIAALHSLDTSPLNEMYINIGTLNTWAKKDARRILAKPVKDWVDPYAIRGGEKEATTNIYLLRNVNIDTRVLSEYQSDIDPYC